MLTWSYTQEALRANALLQFNFENVSSQRQFFSALAGTGSITRSSPLSLSHYLSLSVACWIGSTKDWWWCFRSRNTSGYCSPTAITTIVLVRRWRNERESYGSINHQTNWQNLLAVRRFVQRRPSLTWNGYLKTKPGERADERKGRGRHQILDFALPAGFKTLKRENLNGKLLWMTSKARSASRRFNGSLSRENRLVRRVYQVHKPLE